MAGLRLARPGAWGWEIEGRRGAPRVAVGQSRLRSRVMYTKDSVRGCERCDMASHHDPVNLHLMFGRKGFFQKLVKELNFTLHLLGSKLVHSQARQDNL